MNLKNALTGIVLLILLYSCSSNSSSSQSAENDDIIRKPPSDLFERQGSPPEKLTGLWKPCLEKKESEEDASVEIRLFNSGIIMFRARWSGETPSHVSFGNYRYDSLIGELLIDTDGSIGTLITNVQGNPACFTVEDTKFIRRATNPSGEPQADTDDITGAWHLDYLSVGEASAISLFLHASGAFTETTYYGDGNDLLSETGSWHLSKEDGLVIFTYDRLPEAGFIAMVDLSENIFVTPGGEFRRAAR